MNAFPGASPFQPAAVDTALQPHPPGAIPTPPAPGDAMATLSPFVEPLDVDKIIANLTLDRPLKLFVPGREKYPDWEFRIINSIPQEIADAHNKGWREITDPEMTKLFVDLVAGTDKNGRQFRPILCARPKQVGAHVWRQHRLQLKSLYAGMDPTNKEFQSGYAKNITSGQDASAAEFKGQVFKIKV